MKVKVRADWQTNEQMRNSFAHTIKNLQHGEITFKRLVIVMDHYNLIGLDCLIVHINL
jgi:hypothetical protein